MKIANYYMDAIQMLAGATSKDNAIKSLEAINREAQEDEEVSDMQCLKLEVWITVTLQILDAAGALDLLDE